MGLALIDGRPVAACANFRRRRQGRQAARNRVGCGKIQRLRFRMSVLRTVSLAVGLSPAQLFAIAEFAQQYRQRLGGAGRTHGGCEAVHQDASGAGMDRNKAIDVDAQSGTDRRGRGVAIQRTIER